MTRRIAPSHGSHFTTNQQQASDTKSVSSSVLSYTGPEHSKVAGSEFISPQNASGGAAGTGNASNPYQTRSVPIRKCSRLLFVLLLSFALPFILVTILNNVLSSQLASTAAMNLAIANVVQISTSVHENLRSTISIPPRMLRQSIGKWELAVQEENNNYLYSTKSMQDGLPSLYDMALAADQETPLAGAYAVLEKRGPKFRNSPPEAYGILVSGVGQSRTSEVWWMRQVGNESSDSRMTFTPTRGNSFPQVMEAGFNNTGNALPYSSNSYPVTISDLPWYVNGRDNLFPKLGTDIVWTAPYNDALFSDATFVSCFHALRNRTASGEWLGIVGIDFTLQTIQEYMLSLDSYLTPGVAFVMERQSGILIGTSDRGAPSTIISQDPNTGKKNIDRVKASKSSSSIIREVSQYFFNHEKELKASSTLSIPVDGVGSVLFTFAEFKDDYGMDWVVLVCLPEYAFMADIDTMKLTTLLVSLGTMAIAGAFIFALSLCFIWPLLRLKTEMRKVELMKLDQVRHPKSIFYEIFTIQSSFYTMKEKLRLWKTYLPEHVLLSEGLLENDISGAQGDEDDDVDPFADDETQSMHSADKQSASSRARSQNSSKRSHSKQSSELENHLGLKSMYRNSTSIVILIHNYKEISHNQRAFIDQYAVVLERIRNICGRCNAVVDHFDEREFHISLNAVLPVKKHRVVAVNLVVQIDDAIQKANTIFLHDKREKVLLSYGIATGHSFSGTIGNASLRKNRIYGDSRENAVALSRLASDYHSQGIRILCDSDVHTSLNRKRFKHRPFGIYALRDQRRLKVVYHIYSSMKDDSHQEWMYEVEAAKRHEEWEPLHEALSLMKKNHFQKAISMIQSIEKSSSEGGDDDLEEQQSASNSNLSIQQKWISFSQQMASRNLQYDSLQHIRDNLKESQERELFSGRLYVDAMKSLVGIRDAEEEES